MSDPTELDELQSGVTSGFYQRLQAYADREWGPSGELFQQYLRQALSGVIGTEAETVHRLKNLTFAQQQIQSLLQWPQQRIAQLTAQKEKASQATSGSRRGPCL